MLSRNTQSRVAHQLASQSFPSFSAGTALAPPVVNTLLGYKNWSSLIVIFRSPVRGTAGQPGWRELLEKEIGYENKKTFSVGRGLRATG
jgi:hypothetical protein